MLPSIQGDVQGTLEDSNPAAQPGEGLRLTPIICGPEVTDSRRQTMELGRRRPRPQKKQRAVGVEGPAEARAATSGGGEDGWACAGLCAAAGHGCQDQCIPPQRMHGYGWGAGAS